MLCPVCPLVGLSSTRWVSSVTRIFCVQSIIATISSLWGFLVETIILTRQPANLWTSLLSAQVKLQSPAGSHYVTPVGRCSERSQKGYQLSTLLQCTSSYGGINMPWYKSRLYLYHTDFTASNSASALTPMTRSSSTIVAGNAKHSLKHKFLYFSCYVYCFCDLDLLATSQCGQFMSMLIGGPTVRLLLWSNTCKQKMASITEIPEENFTPGGPWPPETANVVRHIILETELRRQKSANDFFYHFFCQANPDFLPALPKSSEFNVTSADSGTRDTSLPGYCGLTHCRHAPRFSDTWHRINARTAHEKDSPQTTNLLHALPLLATWTFCRFFLPQEPWNSNSEWPDWTKKFL